MNKKRIIRFLVTALVVSICIYCYRHYDLGTFLTREKMQAFLAPFGAWIPVIYLTLFTFAMMFNIPASLFLITVGTVLGPLWGSVVGLIGCYSASLLLFMMAKNLKLDWVKAKFGVKWDSFNLHLEKNGFLYLAITRSLSIFPFGLICYASGITMIKPMDYIKASFIGCMPQVIIYCYTVPTFLTTKKLSFDNLVTIFISTLVWLAFFGLVYLTTKKQTNDENTETLAYLPIEATQTL